MSKVWFVTGSSRGLGRSVAEAVLAHGDRLVATARHPEQLSDLVTRYGEQIRAIALDVTNPEQARTAIVSALDAFGRIDVVANNAGYANSAPIEETTDADFRAQVETNLFGVVNVTKAALPVFHRQRSGHFLQFSSVGGRVGGTPGLGAYQTAKFAVEGFSEVLHNEVATLGIKVTIIEPGAFRTDWGGSSMHIGDVGEDYQETVGRIHDYRRKADGNQQGDPHRAANVIVRITDLEEPPLRLLLGSDAVHLAEQAAIARAQEAEKWADISRSTDYGTSPDFANTPVADLFDPKKH